MNILLIEDEKKVASFIKKGLEEELDLYSLIALAGAGSELYIYDPQVIRPSPFSDLCVVNVKDIIRSWLSPDSPLQDNPLAQEFKEEVISASAQWLSEQTQSPLFFFRPQKKMALAEAKLFLEELLNRHFFVEAKPENKHEVNS